MAQPLATYALDGELHRIELVPLRDGAIVLDRATEGPAVVVVELAPGEGEEQALAVIHAGGYLERAEAGETRLGRALSAGSGAVRSTPRAKAA